MTPNATDEGRGRSALLPRPTRGPLLAVALLASGALVPLSATVAHRTGTTGVDRLLQRPVPDWGPLQALMELAARPLPALMPVVAALGALVCWNRAERRAAVFLVVGPATALSVAEGLKPLLSRPSRSGRGGWTFPSGHVTAVASVATVLAVLLLPQGALRRLCSPVPPLLGAAALAALVGATSLATVSQGYHPPTDVLGGLLVALASVPLAAALVDGFANGWTRHHPESGAEP